MFSIIALAKKVALLKQSIENHLDSSATHSAKVLPIIEKDRGNFNVRHDVRVYKV